MEIPLFPLRTVLFPGMELPLQIFEERYKAMTRELLAGGGVFGVLLIRQGQEVGGLAVPYEVGTTAFIEQAEELPQGRFRLTARGKDRFRVRKMLPPRPYPYGEVELVDDREWDLDDEGRAAMGRVRAAFPEYFRLALSLSDQWARGVDLPDTPHALVNSLVTWLQADELAKQRLLEIEAASQRVTYLAKMLEVLLAKTRAEAAAHEQQKYRNLGSSN